jgi:hypothetical protein
MQIDLTLTYRNGTVIRRKNQTEWDVLKGPILHPFTAERPVNIHILNDLGLSPDRLKEFHKDLVSRLRPGTPRGQVTYAND